MRGIVCCINYDVFDIIFTTISVYIRISCVRLRLGLCDFDVITICILNTFVFFCLFIFFYVGPDSVYVGVTERMNWLDGCEIITFYNTDEFFSFFFFFIFVHFIFGLLPTKYYRRFDSTVIRVRYHISTSTHENRNYVQTFTTNRLIVSIRFRSSSTVVRCAMSKTKRKTKNFSSDASRTQTITGRRDEDAF